MNSRRAFMKPITLAGVFLLGLLLVGTTVFGQSGPANQGVSLNPTHTAPKTAASTARALPTETDPRAEQIASALKDKLNYIQTAAPSAAQNRPIGLAARVGRSDPGFEFYTRSGVGTPMMIKADGEPLQRCVSRMGPGMARDTQTALEFFNANSGLLRLNNPEQELELIKYYVGSLGRSHLRYSQHYNGLDVWPAELTVHLDESGNVYLLNGAYVPTPSTYKLSTQPAVTAEAAAEFTAGIVPDAAPENVDDPELMIYAPGDKAPRLAWRMNVSVSFDAFWLVLIDAENGSKLLAFNQIMPQNVSGSGTDLLGQTRQMNVWSEQGSYYLIDTTKPMYQANVDIREKGAVMVYDLNNQEQGTMYVVSSTSPTSGWLADGVSLFYSLTETYDYYYQKHNRNSIDGNGLSVRGVCRLGSNYLNAFWNPEMKMMFFGDALPFSAALDVVAHEFTHGVTSHTSNLVYQGQSGALNESMSDIFGIAAQARSKGQVDWIMGEDLNNADMIRNIRNPGAVDWTPGQAYPAKMSEFYQLPNDQDHGGVHINCTIVAHAFYQLAQGLSNPIGLDDAAAIFYRANTTHLVTNSQFIDCRLACIQSAEELFGAGSIQAQKTAEAFDYVEIVGSSSGTPSTPPTTPPVTGDDALVFVYWDATMMNFRLGRRDAAQGDGPSGVILSTSAAAASRASVTGDGTLAFFVTADYDAAFVNLSTYVEAPLGFPGQIQSVAMSPDGNLYGFVFRDPSSGEALDTISVIDLAGDTTKTFDLVAPTTSHDQTTMNTILYADAMDFTQDGKMFFYDAYNVMQLADGSAVGGWSIYAIDLQTEQTLSVVSPVPGLNIGNPAVSQTSDQILTFEASDTSSGTSTIYTGNLITGKTYQVGSISSGVAVPGYNGDDTAIVYTAPDSSTYIGTSLMQQPLSGDHLNASGSSFQTYSGGYAGVVYRTGSYTKPDASVNVNPSSLSFPSTSTGAVTTKDLTISNSGTDEVKIVSIKPTGTHASEFKVGGACLGQNIPPGGSCMAAVKFTPQSAGAKSATLTLTTDDADTPTISVPASGTAVQGSTPSGDSYTGWWYNAGEPGVGLSMEEQNNILFLVWYAYDATGRPTWYVAWAPDQGGGKFSGDLRLYTGWELGKPWSMPAFSKVGTVSVTFSDYDTATLEWQLDIPFSNPGSKSIEKYMPSLVSGSKDPRGLDGWWVDSNYPGMGFFVETKGETLYLGWYHFRADGTARWWVQGGWKDVGGFSSGTTTYQAAMQEYQGGPIIGGTHTNASETAGGGQATLSISGSGDSLSLSLNWSGNTFNLVPYTFNAVPN